MNFEDSKTYANLLTAYAGESGARNKYSFYASQARKDGFEQIADIFEETAKNEYAHAKIWFKELHGGEIPKTEENLKDGIAGEKYEWSKMYADFEREAREEGYDKLAALFKMVGQIEKSHEERYKALLKSLEDGIVFSKTDEVVWICRNCGYIHYGKSAPKVCPVCAHPQSFFEQKAENY